MDRQGSEDDIDKRGRDGGLKEEEATLGATKDDEGRIQTATDAGKRRGSRSKGAGVG